MQSEEMGESIRGKTTNIMDIIQPKSERSENSEETCHQEYQTQANNTTFAQQSGPMETNSRMFMHPGLYILKLRQKKTENCISNISSRLRGITSKYNWRKFRWTALYVRTKSFCLFSI